MRYHRASLLANATAASRRLVQRRRPARDAHALCAPQDGELLRDLRRTFTAAGDLGWRAEAAQRLDAAGISATALHDRLKGQIASRLLTEVA